MLRGPWAFSIIIPFVRGRSWGRGEMRLEPPDLQSIPPMSTNFFFPRTEPPDLLAASPMSTNFFFPVPDPPDLRIPIAVSTNFFFPRNPFQVVFQAFGGDPAILLREFYPGGLHLFASSGQEGGP